MKTFCFKLYKSERNYKLHKQINAAGLIYNHCIALHKRYYKLYHKSLNVNKLKKHLTKLKKVDKFSYLLKIGSQAVQDVAERQAGWKLDESTHTLRVNGQAYRYFQSRRISRKIKTVTVKRDSLDDTYVYFVTDATDFKVKTQTGKSVGYDFGLKKFLTASDGADVISPLFFAQNAKLIKQACRHLSLKMKGSNNRRRAKLNLARLYKKLVNQRHDFHFKLALS